VFGADNARLLAAVAAAQPDIIAVTGDLEDQLRGHDAAWLDTVAAGLVNIAPVYYVTGNHEWATGGVPALKETLTAAGWTVLSNRYLPLEQNGETVIVAGIDDPNGYADQKTPETLTAELYAAHGDPFWILLAHRNDHFAGQYSLLGADLTLSGHGHGGIIRLPFTDGLLGTQHNFFPTHTAGLYEENGSALFVSRGIGNVGITFRLFNRPEVAVLTLYKG
jgi:predicted MPP superfamily phosphohydrolase